MTTKKYLLHALDLAAQRRGFCAPNPAVGAVIVNNEKIVGQGSHFGAGYPHAEVNAIKNAGDNAKNSIIYVTLEPCCHTGRTPPCVNAIIQAGIKKVYFAYVDPNPTVAGKGQQALINSGIPCEHIPVTEINDFYRSYQYWTQYRKPWVTIKLALSADNKIAYSNGSPAKITGPELQTFTHQQRLKSDAILSTYSTILCDNPHLNVRLPQQTIAKNIYILDSRLRLSENALIHKTAAKITQLHNVKDNTSGIFIEKNSDGLDINSVFNAIGADGIHDLWIEAGSKLFNSVISARLANEIYIYHSKIILGADAKDANINQEKLNLYYQIIESKFFGNEFLYKYGAS